MADSQLQPEEQPANPHMSEQEIHDLILNNIGLAYHIAHSWKGNVTRVSPEDVDAIAIQGLVKAANSYNPAQWNNFAAYAGRTIRNYLGHQKHWGQIHHSVQPFDIDAPVGDAEGGEDDSSMHDKLTGSGKTAPEEVTRRNAERVLQATINRLHEPHRGILKEWMSGKSYREIQASPVSGGKSFVWIAASVKQSLEAVKNSLRDQGYSEMADLWSEDLEDVTGPQLFEMLVDRIELAQLGLLEELCNLITAKK